MREPLTEQDRKRIEEDIRRKYAGVSGSPEGRFRYPTGRSGLAGLHYGPELTRGLPEAVQASYCGVGNPFSLGPIHPGEAVLDIGCGGGVDTLIAAVLAGPAGSAVGVDPVPEMLERAGENLRMTAPGNARFERASAEKLPFPDESFDVALSNGAFNLVADKARALAEVFRVLRPGGRLMFADQVLAGDAAPDPKNRVADWFK